MQMDAGEKRSHRKLPAAFTHRGVTCCHNASVIWVVHFLLSFQTAARGFPHAIIPIIDHRRRFGNRFAKNFCLQFSAEGGKAAARAPFPSDDASSFAEGGENARNIHTRGKERDERFGSENSALCRRKTAAKTGDQLVAQHFIEAVEEDDALIVDDEIGRASCRERV